MNSKILFIGLTFFFLANVMTAQNKIWWTSLDKLDEKVSQNSKKYMVYIYFDGCKWCKSMEEETFGENTIARYINAHFNAFQINAQSAEKIIIDGKTYSSTKSGKYDFNGLATELLNGKMRFPGIVFLDENFKKLASYTTFIKPEEFELLLAYYADEFYKSMIWPKFIESKCNSKYNTLPASNR